MREKQLMEMSNLCV